MMHHIKLIFSVNTNEQSSEKMISSKDCFLKEEVFSIKLNARKRLVLPESLYPAMMLRLSNSNLKKEFETVKDSF